MSRNILSKSHTSYDVFPHKLIALLIWLSKVLLKKVNKINNVEVNIMTSHVTYGVLRDFNSEGHNIIIAFFLRRELCLAYRCTKIKYLKLC